MEYKTERQLNTALNKGELHDIYLLYGKDSYLIELYQNKIRRLVVKKEEESFGYDRFEGRKIDMDALYDSILAVPFLSERRLVLLDDPEIDKLSTGDHKKFMEILEAVGEGTVLLISIKQADFLPKKSAKCRKVLEFVQKVGGVAELNGRSEKDLADFVTKRLGEAGATIDSRDAVYLVERCSGDMMMLDGEVKKLASSGETVVTRELIESHTTQTVDAKIFDLSKCILRRDYAGAMDLLDRLLYLREPETGILSTLSLAFVDMYRAAAMKREDVSVAGGVASFDYRGRDFRLKNAMRDASRYSLSFLKSSLDILADADYKLKSSRADGRIVLEQAITEICVALQREGGR